MIKFVIITRHKPGLTRERFFYEWAFIHVSLMVHTASSMRRFKRYAQHFVNPDIADAFRVLPAAPMQWENFAEHWLPRWEAYAPAPDYVEIMRPHSFSDSAMEIAYLEGDVVHQRDDFQPGGVKLIHRLVRRPGLSTEAFQRHLREVHAPTVVVALADKGLRKYEIDLPHPIDLDALRASRKGTLFDQADVGTADAFEELWFDSLDAALQLGADPALRQTLTASLGAFVDLERSYSMFANERVVFDFVTPGHTTPLPAVLQEGSLEATLFSSGKPYAEPQP